MKKDKVGGACSTHGEKERSMQYFKQKTLELDVGEKWCEIGNWIQLTRDGYNGELL
jgi:hypothetical protein